MFQPFQGVLLNICQNRICCGSIETVEQDKVRRKRGSSVSTVNRLRAERPDFDSRLSQEFFSLFHCVQTGSGAHPTSYPVSIGALHLEVKWPGREANRSPPSSAEDKNAWSYTSTSEYDFLRGA
jgi:hypothetical protein